MPVSHGPPRHGYQILPTIIADGPVAEQRSASVWYSWPWTDGLIQRQLVELARSEAELNRAVGSNSIARRRRYQELSNDYRQMRTAQNTIDAHIQYNRLWQPAIAADRPGYDLETLLHDMVVERQAILDALQASEDAAFKKALVELTQGNTFQSLTKRRRGLIEREKTLARAIHDATPAREYALLYSCRAS